MKAALRGLVIAAALLEATTLGAWSASSVRADGASEGSRPPMAGSSAKGEITVQVMVHDNNIANDERWNRSPIFHPGSRVKVHLRRANGSEDSVLTDSLGRATFRKISSGSVVIYGHAGNAIDKTRQKTVVFGGNAIIDTLWLVRNVQLYR